MTEPDDWPIVSLPIEEFLDLHAFSPKEVSSLIEEYLFQCQAKGYSEVRLIHGKGTGTLRRKVRAQLARDPRVLTYGDAPTEAGGWGATLVHLKSKFSK
ncbi:MAG: Smr/MutS family protein [Terriglobia bacterium]